MQFIHQPLTWAFLLVLVPLLIHLINLMRQKKVKWAAMEFLLKSNKKHRRWVWLKQFLLLLLRMMVVAVAVAMLAGLVTNDQASFLGGQATHHFIVLDDSISMGDRSSDGRAFDRADQVLRRIAEQLAQQPTDQKVTLLRFSEVTKTPTSSDDTPDSTSTLVADMNAVTVDSEFPETMEDVKRRFDVSDLALSPIAALEFADTLIANAAERSRIVYLLSDFRSKEWDRSSEVKEVLRSLKKHNAELHLIRCVDSHHQNLAITDVEPDAGTLAAGVPLLVNIKVKNFGPSASQQVAIRVSAKSYPEDLVVGSEEQVVEEQINQLIVGEIPAGEVATRQAQLKFDRAGQHIVTASLVSDALDADNTRECLIEIPAAIPVLLVDGSGQNEESYYLQSVFAPGRVLTGINPVLRSNAYLRDATDDDLARYAAIYLLNLERLAPKAMSALNRYVKAGGGLAIFAGPNTDPAWLMEMHDDGSGLFPIPVQSERDTVRAGDEAPDLQVSDHPIFRVLVGEGGENRPLLRRIRIDRLLGVDPDWDPEATPDTKVLATLRNADPVVVSRRFGDGQVVAFLTTASPTWNNWAMGPSYPVVLLQLHGFLSSTQHRHQQATTGDPISFQLDTAEYRPQVEFVLPKQTVDSVLTSIKKEADLTSIGDATLVPFEIGRNPEVDRTNGNDPRNGETDRRGVYVAKLVTLDGQARQNRFVLNSPTSESDFDIIANSELAEQLDELEVVLHSADELEYESTQQEGFSWSQLLIGILIALLLGEQLLAYSTSYHPKDEKRTIQPTRRFAEGTLP